MSHQGTSQPGQSGRDSLAAMLAHLSYHVGQIVLLARIMQKGSWKWLTVPKGGSEAYNENPTLERGKQ